MMSSKTSAMGATTLMAPGGNIGRDGGGATIAVVEKVSVAVAVPPFGSGVTGDGAIAHVDLVGCPVQARVTAALKVPTDVTVIVEVPFEPFATVGIGLGEADRVKPGATAAMVPVRATVCGLEESPSVMVKVPASAVATEGVKITFTAQLPSAGITAGGPEQVFVAAKSLAGRAVAGVVVLATALVKVIAALVLLVSVTVPGVPATPTAVEVSGNVVTEIVSVGAVRLREATNASAVLTRLGWSAPVVAGRFDENVCPAMNTVGKALKAIPNA